jgi:hypothetical protein
MRLALIPLVGLRRTIGSRHLSPQVGSSPLTNKCLLCGDIKLTDNSVTETQVPRLGTILSDTRCATSVERHALGDTR